MNFVDATIARLKTIEALGERVEGAVDLADMVKRNLQPQRTPHSYVLPSGSDGEEATQMTGLTRQRVREVVSVIVIERKAGDAKGEAARKSSAAVHDDIIAAMVGWMPGAAYEAVTLLRSRFLDMVDGAVFSQIDFQTRGYLRAPNT